jgi:hypothetical protein
MQPTPETSTPEMYTHMAAVLHQDCFATLPHPTNWRRSTLQPQHWFFSDDDEVIILVNGIEQFKWKRSLGEQINHIWTGGRPYFAITPLAGLRVFRAVRWTLWGILEEALAGSVWARNHLPSFLSVVGA